MKSETKANRTEPKRYQARPVTVASDQSVLYRLVDSTDRSHAQSSGYSAEGDVR